MTSTVGGQEYADLALEVLKAYEFPEGTTIRLISLSENATFLIEHGRPLGILRIYREGYQNSAEMASELAWISAIRASNTVETPAVILNSPGQTMTSVSVNGSHGTGAVFQHVDGRELAEDDTHVYDVVGSTAASLHLQVSTWTPPEWFERKIWDLETILGPAAHWGDWREGPGVDASGRELLERAEFRIRGNLAEYPVEGRGGLVHCDLRAANLMLDDDAQIWVIDFDDSGFSWFLWDLCSTTTLVEQCPDLPDIVSAWMRGYQSIRQLSSEDIEVIPDLVFLRRLHLLAWLGSHPESDLAHEFGTKYTTDTYVIAERYLAGEFLPNLA